MNLPHISLCRTRLLPALVLLTALFGGVPHMVNGANAYTPFAGRHVTVLGEVDVDVESIDRPSTPPENRREGAAQGTASPSAIQSGLVIHATFDTSITGNPNAAAIEAAINRAIAIYESLFADSITIEIYFRYAPTLPDGTPFPEGAGAQSISVRYGVPWSIFISSMIADSRTDHDATASSSLPISPISTNLVPSSAEGRAVGLATPPAMFADGHVADGGPYDGIVTLNSTSAFQFTRPPSSTNYDAQTVFEHEIDEVLGLGSFLNQPAEPDLGPEDLFSWSAAGTRNYTKVGSRYFSVNNGNSVIVAFSQDPMGDFGDWLSGSCPQLHPYVQNAFGCKGQFSDVTSTSPEGIALDVIGYDLAPEILPPGVSSLANISTRGFVQTGDGSLIGGFIVTGTQSKKVIVRAIGPSLPVSGFLADPVLELHDVSGALIVSNDNWRTAQEAEIVATGVPPTNDFEAAIVTTLDPGAYTAVVSGSNNGSGVALVEVYDLDQTVDSKLANISTRGFVGTDENLLIGGFIVLGNNPATTIIRALGPSLGDIGVNGALQDPELEIHDSYGTLIVSNDNWRSDQESDITATSIAPDKDAESAIVKTLGPGAYTTIVSGTDDSTGIALVEIYQL